MSILERLFVLEDIFELECPFVLISSFELEHPTNPEGVFELEGPFVQISPFVLVRLFLLELSFSCERLSLLTPCS